MSIQKIFTGKGIPVRGNEIDTDRIIPARFMKCVTFTGLGKYAFYDERYSEDDSPKGHVFDRPEYANHTILAVNKNFGCGSSREHAPQALKDYGIHAIIGESFAEIFAGNCTALGIPAVQAPYDDITALQNLLDNAPETVIDIDISAQTITAGSLVFRINMPDAYRNSFLDGSWDSTSLLMEGEKEIGLLYDRLPYLHFDTTTNMP